MNDDFGVGMVGIKTMPFGHKVLAESLKVIDLAVKHRPDGLVFIVDGLMPRLDVDDAETAHPEIDLRIGIIAVLIRAPMKDRGRHPF
jgi:hypothetical protein